MLASNTQLSPHRQEKKHKRADKGDQEQKGKHRSSKKQKLGRFLSCYPFLFCFSSFPTTSLLFLVWSPCLGFGWNNIPRWRTWFRGTLLSSKDLIPLKRILWFFWRFSVILVLLSFATSIYTFQIWRMQTAFNPGLLGIHSPRWT